MQCVYIILNGTNLSKTRLIAIHSVTVASHQADFVHHDPLAHLNVSNPQDCHTYPELKRKIYSALAEGDEGELSIAIPREVPLRPSGHAAANTIMSESEGAFSAPSMTSQTDIINSRNSGAADARTFFADASFGT